MTGVAKALLTFHKQARADGLAEVTIGTFVRHSPSKPESNEFLRAVRTLGFPVETFLEQNAADVRAALRLRRFLHSFRPHIVETHAVKSHVLMRFCRTEGSAWVAFHHGYTRQDAKMRMYNRMNPWALRAADAVVTVCQPFEAELAGSGVPQSMIHVIPNAIEPVPVPLHDGTAVRDEWNVPAGTRVILSIGRLSAEKGHRFLLEAAALLRDSGRFPFVMLLVGDGPERRRLEEQSGVLGLEQYVRFCGQQSQPLRFHTAADVFVLPSLSEGSPLALLESMQMRTPIVATAVGGIPETVADGVSACLVPAGDAGKLAEALNRVLSDGSLASSLASAAHHAVTTRRNPKAYARRLLELYSSVLASVPPFPD